MLHTRESAVPGETQPTVELRAVPPRDLADVADMAIAIQANLVQLAVAQARRLGSGRETGIRTPAPGAVRRFREVLLDHGQIAAYDDLGLAMRLRECWGQHCVMCWLFSTADPQDPPDFRELQSTGPVRCPAAVACKCLEIENCLWRLRFELRLREGAAPGCSGDPGPGHGAAAGAEQPGEHAAGGVRVRRHAGRGPLDLRSALDVGPSGHHGLALVCAVPLLTPDPRPLHCLLRCRPLV
jgi:hypothetical protein